MIEREYILTLYETYNKLLTEREKNYFEYYYFEDYSMQEIADLYEVSKAYASKYLNQIVSKLEKMNRVISDIVPNNPVETLLVIDATTGQNGISQAKSFKEITNITGIVLTKLDGTAKGGIVLAIKENTNIPVKFVGLGEKETDLIPFDIEKYIYGLFKEF